MYYIFCIGLTGPRVKFMNANVRIFNQGSKIYLEIFFFKFKIIFPKHFKATNFLN